MMLASIYPIIAIALLQLMDHGDEVFFSKYSFLTLHVSNCDQWRFLNQQQLTDDEDYSTIRKYL